MAQRVVFIADPLATVTQALVTSGLAALHAANPISQLYLHDVTVPDVYAAQWAQTNGVPWLNLSSYLDGAGYVDPFSRSSTHLLFAGGSSPVLPSLLTVGNGSHATAAAAIGNKRGHSVTQL